MHSLMYGTPAIAHGDFDAQMPEVEAIEPGVTGAFCRRDDANDLAATIAAWLDHAPPRERVRAVARAATHAKWTPQVQARIIEQAVLEVAGHAERALLAELPEPQRVTEAMIEHCRCEVEGSAKALLRP